MSDEPATHVTNLAVLSQFFNQTDLGDLASDTFLNHTITATLPEFQFFGHDYTRDLAAVDNTKFQLDKAVNLSISRQLVYRSLSEYLSHQQTLEMSDSTDFLFDIPNYFKSPLTIVSLVLSVLAFVFSVLLCMKLRALSVLFAVKPTYALPTHFNFFPPTTPLLPSSTTVSIDALHEFYNDLIFWLMLAVMLLIAAILLYHIFHESRAHKELRHLRTKVYLHMSAPGVNVYIYFLTLSRPIRTYGFLGIPILKRPQIRGYFFPRLHVEWQDMKILDHITQECVKLPGKIKISPSQATMLRSVCQQVDKLTVMFFEHRHGMTAPAPISLTPYMLKLEQPSAPPTSENAAAPARIYPIV